MKQSIDAQVPKVLKDALKDDDSSRTVGKSAPPSDLLHQDDNSSNGYVGKLGPGRWLLPDITVVWIN